MTFYNFYNRAGNVFNFFLFYFSPGRTTEERDVKRGVALRPRRKLYAWRGRREKQICIITKRPAVGRRPAGSITVVIFHSCCSAATGSIEFAINSFFAEIELLGGGLFVYFFFFFFSSCPARAPSKSWRNVRRNGRKYVYKVQCNLYSVVKNFTHRFTTDNLLFR